MLRKAIIVTAIIVCLNIIGCETHSQNKKLAAERWDKASSEIKLKLAQQKYENNDLDEAREAVSECITADPNNAQVHLLYGKLLLTEDKGTDAVKELQLAVELDEKLGEGWYWLGVAAERQEQSQQTLFYYNKALALNPANVDYILSVAETYAEQEKPGEAIKLLEEKIAAMPREVLLKVAAADLMWRAGGNERAIELYKEAMLMRGDDSSIAEALGYCYVFSGRWSEGAEIFNELAEQCEDEQQKKLYLQAEALCSVNCAQYDRAVNCYNELSVEGRDDAEIWLKMGQAALGAGAAERSLMCGERALVLQPGDADATTLVGCAQYSMGDYAAAIKNFEKTASDEKNGGISWLMRARCYEQLGLDNEAGQAYKKALEIEPHSKLGDLLAKGKNVDDLGFTTED
ncbi:MAG: tetratricopeptide repeat protein [Phycisphaerae bacterium]|nr:tetratricopeptide repeat protein [Phycisphaerae bacterium]MDD5381249.1 tetratricopeptide repeat protein [Phycisphaerae bacterium]